MWKSDNFSKYLNFYEKRFFLYFKSQISKWKHMSGLLSMARGLKDSYSLSNKQIQYISSHRSPCRTISEYFLVKIKTLFLSFGNTFLVIIRWNTFHSWEYLSVYDSGFVLSLFRHGLQAWKGNSCFSYFNFVVIK